MLYVGANDGMLHAFYASAEHRPIRRRPGSLGDHPERGAAQPLQARRRRLQARQPPVLRRRHAGRSATSGTARHWKTILVGGLNAGGKGYYALDVTDPARAEAAVGVQAGLGHCPAPAPAASRRHHADCNLGLTFGKPVITKLGDGTWVVMVTSGYNNVNGVGRRRRGLPLRARRAHRRDHPQDRDRRGRRARRRAGWRRSTTTSTTSTIDNTTLRAYGGDVLGNIWRFDFTPTPGRRTLLGTAKDAASNAAADHGPARARRARRQAVRHRRHRQAARRDRRRRPAEAVGLRHRRSAGRRRPDLRGSAARRAAADEDRPGRHAAPAATRTHRAAPAPRRSATGRRLGARPARGGRAGQRRDEAALGDAGLREQRARSRCRAASAATAGSTRSTSAPAPAIPGARARSSWPTRSTSASTCSSCRRRPGGGNPKRIAAHPPERRHEHHQGPQAAGAAAGRQADQLARDRPVEPCGGRA